MTDDGEQGSLPVIQVRRQRGGWALKESHDDDRDQHCLPLTMPRRPSNTKISCEDRTILALAGFVSFILLFDGAGRSLSATVANPLIPCWEQMPFLPQHPRPDSIPKHE